jgi:Fe-S cluster assembly protein SufD
MTALDLTNLETRRAQARTVFEGHGLPTRRVEDWKYSDLKSALGEAGLGEATAHARLLGRLPEGVDYCDLENPKPWAAAHFGKLQFGAGNAVSEASMAFAEGGLALRVPAGKTIAEPLMLEPGGVGHLRLLLVVEAGASLTLYESTDTAGPRNAGFEIVLGEGAHLAHIRLARPVETVQVEEIAISVAANARYDGHFASFGGKLARAEIIIALEGEGAQAHLSGVSVLGGTAHADVTTHVIHRKGNTQSTQLFKHVAGGKARAIYQGRVTVAKGADGADSRQTAKALLLSETAEADLKPELEIFADDVKCAHGAAIGDLDAEQIFYLRARGIAEDHARALLMYAFLEDALDSIANDDLRGAVRTGVQTALRSLL